MPTFTAHQGFGYARADRPDVSESHESHDAFAEFYGRWATIDV